jgi:hypothetical protein
MDVISGVVELAREAEDLRERIDDFDKQMESLIGSTVTLTVRQGKKRKFYECTVDTWNGESWELTENSTDDDPEFFEATFDDFVKGRMWVLK